jgi:hypothetical protein
MIERADRFETPEEQRGYCMEVRRASFQRMYGRPAPGTTRARQAPVAPAPAPVSTQPTQANSPAHQNMRKSFLAATGRGYELED